MDAAEKKLRASKRRALERRRAELLKALRNPRIWEIVGDLIATRLPNGVNTDHISQTVTTDDFADVIRHAFDATDVRRDNVIWDAGQILFWQWAKLERPTVHVPYEVRRNLAALHGRDFMPQESDVIRDLLLMGRDDEAFDMLGIDTGARLYWNRDFWIGAAHANKGHIKIESGTTFMALGSDDGIDGLDDAHNAVGWAIQMFIDWGKPAVVKLVPPWRPDAEGFGQTDEEEPIIFAIAATNQQLREIVPTAVPAEEA